ncbi:MAG: hypothetical protein H6819_04685 [Phycisphaerales bacterium]|nr:hypothetical protein [Phycisphaerales bacterium]MCB9856497.1 hypothetical protein [Phycisphaerales bacterium]MCB9863978.1 hypothetical protein [Phycisphaerales bacterium]
MQRVQLFAVVVLAAIGLIAFGVYQTMSGPGAVRAEAGAPVQIDASASEHNQLAQAYEAKLANADYVSYKTNSSGRGFQDFAEESRIKEIRSKIAAHVKAPTGTKLFHIPVVSDAPVLDGGFSEGEWDKAARFSIGVNGADTTLYMMATSENLYLAADVPGDTTKDGFDQFRFYYHLNISPLIVNERIHVGKTSEKLGGIRQTEVRWKGAPAANDDERWKKYAISDWSIYDHAFGASSVKQGHRRFEAVLDLSEAGLPVGTPFPARVEVESDPVRDGNGKFKSRTYLGEMGEQTAPVWFVIGR